MYGPSAVGRLSLPPPVLCGLVLLLAASSIPSAWSLQTAPYKVATVCGSTGYLDPLSLTCQNCSMANTVPRTDGNPGCQCQWPYVAQLSADDSSIMSCSACPSNTVPDLLQQNCYQCATSVSSSTSTCTCQSWEIQMEINGTFSCVACPPYQYRSSAFQCSQCSDPTRMTRNNNTGTQCQCATGFSLYQGSCLYNSHSGDNITPTTSSQTVVYSTLGVSVLSATFNSLYVASAKRCKFESNATACEVLTNLCVLQLYATSADACSVYSSMTNPVNDAQNGVVGWPSSVPFLYYPSTLSSSSILQNTDIQQLFELSKSFPITTSVFSGSSGAASVISFYVARYSLSGLYLGLEPMTGHHLSVCLGNDTLINSIFQVGHNVQFTCNYELLNLIYGSRYTTTPAVTQFFDPYFLDSNGLLRPVPVRIINFSNSQYVRRFFTYDVDSGKTDLTQPPTVVRAIATANLLVTMQASNPGSIYYPVIEILYTEQALSTLQTSTVAALPFDNVTALSTSSTAPMATLSATYSMDLSTFWSRILIIFLVLSVFLFFIWGFQMFAFNRLRQNSNIDGEFLLRGLIKLLNLFADYIFLWLAALSIFFFIFFKYQQQIGILLPPQSSVEGYWVAGMVVALVGKIFRLLEILWVQTRVDIFFVDWEKSRGRFVSREPGKKSKNAPVSIWRTLFAANEWNELQTARRTSLILTLFIVLLLLAGFDYQWLATPQPDSNDLTPGPTHIVLSFGVQSLFFGGIWLGQLILGWAFVHRFVAHPLMDFVDMCSLANVSVFVLRESLHGFYIHGRSVHQHAEGTMLELRNNMLKEEENLVATPGLVPESCLQTFEIFITRDVRQQFNDVLLLPIAQNILNMQNQAVVRGSTRVQKQSKTAPVSLIRGYMAMNRFLQNFIDRVQTNPDQVREKSFWQRAFSIPPDVATINKDLFFMDSDATLSSLLSWGVEWDLFLVNFLIFVIISYGLQNVVVGAVVCWIVQLVYDFCRGTFSRWNLSTKTLIDKRFLI